MKLLRPWVLWLTVLFLEFPSARSQASAAGARVEQTPSAQDVRSADEIAIRTAAAQWDKAASAKDLEKVISFYADDASLLPQGAPIATGGACREAHCPPAPAQPGQRPSPPALPQDRTTHSERGGPRHGPRPAGGP